MAEEIVHSRHEWYGGSGYPRGLKGKEIPLAASITALADDYDAITTRRPYKNLMSHELLSRTFENPAARNSTPRSWKHSSGANSSFARSRRNSQTASLTRVLPIGHALSIRRYPKNPASIPEERRDLKSHRGLLPADQ
jgi:HD domain